VPLLRSQSRSLATQMVMLTLTAVSITVLVAAGFVLVGVYRVVDAGQRGRLVAYRQIVMDDLTARLGMAERVVDSVAGASASRSREPGAIGDSLQRAAASNVEQFDLLMVVDASGTVLATAPDQRVPRSVAGQEYFRRASDSLQAVFTWERPKEPGRPGTLWVAQSYVWRSRRYALIGRLRTGFAQRLVDGAASTTEGRTAAVYDNWRTAAHTSRRTQRIPDRARRTWSTRGSSRSTDTGPICRNPRGSRGAYWSASLHRHPSPVCATHCCPRRSA
jgi:hypothetical protein